MTDNLVTSGNDMSSTMIDANGQTTEADTIVDELEQQASVLGLDSIDLDETVYEVLHQQASETVNTSGEDFWTIYHREHDHAAHDASETNNGGLPAQLRLLTEHLGAPEVSDILHDLAAESSPPTTQTTTDHASREENEAETMTDPAPKDRQQTLRSPQQHNAATESGTGPGPS